MKCDLDVKQQFDFYHLFTVIRLCVCDFCGFTSEAAKCGHTFYQQMIHK